MGAPSVRHVDTATRSQFKVPTDKSGNTLTRNEISKEWNGDSGGTKEDSEDVLSSASRLSSTEKCVIRACSSPPLLKDTSVSPYTPPIPLVPFSSMYIPVSLLEWLSEHIENRTQTIQSCFCARASRRVRP